MFLAPDATGFLLGLPGTIFAYVVGLIPAGIAAWADAKWNSIVRTLIAGGAASAMWAVMFPAIATASFYAVIDILTGAELGSVSGPALLYAISIGPGLVLALVDWLVAKTPVLGVIGTTLFVYAALILFLAWDGSAKDIFALGVISAIPAAVCSWLSDKKMGGLNETHQHARRVRPRLLKRDHLCD